MRVVNSSNITMGRAACRRMASVGSMCRLSRWATGRVCIKSWSSGRRRQGIDRPSAPVLTCFASRRYCVSRGLHYISRSPRRGVFAVVVAAPRCWFRAATVRRRRHPRLRRSRSPARRRSRCSHRPDNRSPFSSPPRRQRLAHRQPPSPATIRAARCFLWARRPSLYGHRSDPPDRSVYVRRDCDPGADNQRDEISRLRRQHDSG